MLDLFYREPILCQQDSNPILLQKEHLVGILCLERPVNGMAKNAAVTLKVLQLGVFSYPRHECEITS